ncbi:MAG: cation transporter [Methanobacterium sp.]|uniref:cation diffusion facilitator family transporter n=1 Tax=Methanobacterium sp. TaxID=2164 RepID=UPI003D64676D|nr:cation transporter [Methanobacterium sp.]
MNEYYRTVRRVLIIILVLNIAVALAKVLYGWYSNSLSMLTDGFHSFFDGASNVVGIVGITLAARPADEEHQYGHWKIETFSSIIIAVLLFLVCLEIVQSAVGRFFNPSPPEITTISFLVMGITILINIGVSWYEYRKGREIDSKILVADSMHTRSDIYASIAVIIGFFAINAGYVFVDPIIALAIAALIAKTGIDIIRESSEVLLDKSTINIETIENIVKSVPGVCESHSIRTRGKKSQKYIDLHITVDSSFSIEEAHEIGDNVEVKLRKSIPGIKEVLIHIEPEE